MLVLTRKVGQRIYIGDDGYVVIASIDGGNVRVGIEAPRDIPVIRDNAAKRTPHEHTDRR